MEVFKTWNNNKSVVLAFLSQEDLAKDVKTVAKNIGLISPTHILIDSPVSENADPESLDYLEGLAYTTDIIVSKNSIIKQYSVEEVIEDIEEEVIEDTPNEGIETPPEENTDKKDDEEVVKPKSAPKKSK